MKALLTCNLSDNSVRLGDEVWAPPVITFGETLSLALRFERTVGGAEIEPTFTVEALQASVGFIDARPLANKTALQIGAGAQTIANTTTPVRYDASPRELQDAINALAAVVTAYGAATVRQSEGSWWITFADATAAVPLQLRDNDLFPRSFAEIGAEESDGVWHHEVRLTQVVVDTTATAERILPAEPTITRVQEGGSLGSYTWNEIQRLKVSPDLRTAYYLRFGYARTAFLSVDDGDEDILAALVAVLGGNFAVTLADDFTYDIEFIGDFEGESQEELVVVMDENPPPGDLTFALPLNRRALLHWLRRVPVVELPFEVVMQITETIGEEDVASVVVPIRTTLLIRRPLNWPVMEAAPDIDLTHPTSPKNYRLFNPDNLIVGQAFYEDEIGNGSATVFPVTDGLNTTTKRAWVTENIANGRQLTEGTDYEVRITNANAIEVTALGAAPAVDAWHVVVMSAQTVAAFAAGLEIEIDQVNGLGVLISSLQADVQDLRTLLPSGTLVRPASVGTPDVIEIPDRHVLFPNARIFAAAPEFDPASASGLSGAAARNFPAIEGLKEPLRPPALLSALRDTAAADVSTLPGSPNAGDVIRNTGGTAIALTGGKGLRSSSVAIGAYAGFDGALWYRVTRGVSPSGSTTYFPSDFEQLLVPPITFERDTWRAGQVFAMEADLALQLLRATTNAQWTLVIEHGTTKSETDATAAAIDLTSVGTGVHTLYYDGTALGICTANATTNVLTLTGPLPVDGDVVQVATTGTLPGGLATGMDYVVRDAGSGTLKLAPLTTSLNLAAVTWQATPLLRQRLVVSELKQTRRFGCRVLRSSSNVMTAEVLKARAWEAAGSAPATARFALRWRLIAFDTENSAVGATGYALAALTNVQATTS